MELYLLRHAIATKRDVGGYQDDAERPLTRRGERRMRRIARGLLSLGFRCDAVLTSPYLRSRQTADILVDALNDGPEPLTLDALAPGGSHQELVAQISRLHGPDESLVLVGHQPDLGQLASVLCTGGLSLDLNLRKGGVCRLAVSELSYGRCATLEWLLAPSQLIQLAGGKDSRAGERW
ncbi:MAG: phosphohistidine phosphatase SixA [Anaerolineae bacterium]|nr:phosphohistidine phosphatase SixA [Anaerolineae bacterium]